jgi:two-component system, LytTR family, sensor kinase
MRVKKTLINTDWKLAVLFSATLTIFNMINQNPTRGVGLVNEVLMWLVIFLFLLVNWLVSSNIVSFGTHHDSKLSFKKIFFTILSNLFLLIMLIVSIFLLIGRESFGSQNIYYIFMVIGFRGAVGIGLIYIIQSGLYSNYRAQEVLLQNQMLKTENIRSQLEILKQQISPHFLFNSLATLRSMIRLNNPNSEEFVIKLSEIYRQLLINRQLDAVTVREELSFVNDYIYMLKARFDKMLCITINIPEDLLSMKLPTFSLQLLIENCMKHNIVSSQKPLTIKIFSSSSHTIMVENNLQSKVSQVEKSGYGLENLDQRYNLLGWPDSVNVFTDDGIFRVTLNLLTI